MSVTDQDFAALTARVNALDGQNLPAPTQGQIAVVASSLAGVKKSTNSALLVLESQLTGLLQQVTAIQTQVNQLRGVS